MSGFKPGEVPNHIKEDDLYQSIDKRRDDLKLLLKENLKRIVSFNRAELVLKLSAEQRVEKVMQKLRNNSMNQLGELIRRERHSEVYLPPHLREKRERKTQSQA